MLELNINEPDKLIKVSHALSSEIRVNILQLLKTNNLNVAEIADKINIPVSTAASNIKVLESAGLIRTELVPAARGAMKICRRNFSDIHMRLNSVGETIDNCYEIEMPIGQYIDCHVVPTCGMANSKEVIIPEDEPSSFFHPSRVTAQIIWFSQGHLVYRFPLSIPSNAIVHTIEFSVELCSEAPNYDHNWPSDITAWINGIETGTWTSPGDFGDRRGKLNPSWWYGTFTQYGIQKTWKVDKSGSYIDSVPVSPVTLEDLNLHNQNYIKFSVGVKPDAKHIGGINLFGREFGDYAQDINMKIYYTL
jgi:predicted transcriptional regulator